MSGYSLKKFLEIGWEDDETLKRINTRLKVLKEFEKEYLEFLNVSHRDILDQLKAGKLTDEITATLEKVAQDLSEKYAK